jgi:glucokinase
LTAKTAKTKISRAVTSAKTAKTVRPAKSRDQYALVADIGGTHARFALITLESVAHPELTQIRLLKCGEYPNLDDAIRAYYKDTGIDPKHVIAATIAVAGPVTGDHFSMTNNNWRFSQAEIRKTLGYERFSLINDFTAIAWAIPGLRPDEYATIGAATQSDERAPVGIIGPGSGLGVGGFLRDGTGIVPLQSEGGHSAFAPNDETELKILQILMRRYGRVSNERLLSGPGLVNLYQAISEIREQPARSLSAADITAAALDRSDEQCREALRRFCSVLGALAGDLALMLCAKGGIYIGGGIVPRFIHFLSDSEFRQSFEMKGRFRDYNAAIPTRVILAEFPGLLGAAAHRVHTLS